MGSRIAAHLANCGIPCFLLDIAPQELTEQETKKGLNLASPEVRNRIVRLGLEAAVKSKPPAFYLTENASLITPGNLEDNLSWLGEADWIIEAVAEDFAIKRSLWERVVAHRRSGTVVSTNSSGLSIARLAAGLPEEFRRHWLGTHFFNPPRYLHLLEVIPGPDTLPEVIEAVSHFADVRLGKGIVRAKDTPNFIGNRIGIFCLCTILQRIEEEGLTIEEGDQLTGPMIGWPKSAAFGTLDLIGLDILSNIAQTILQNVPSDQDRDVFRLPGFVQKMLERGLLGNKKGAGFYKRIPANEGESQMLVLDLETLEYRPQKKAKSSLLETAKKIEDASERLRFLLQSQDPASRFLWKVLSQTFLYTARRVPEIADRILEIDRAMKWGFAWELGPFELWDAVGLSESIARMEHDGLDVPESVRRMLSSGRKRFYEDSGRGRQCFDFQSGNYLPLEHPPGILQLHGAKDSPTVVRQTADASLLDLGDRVACVEFHSKMNVIGPDIIAMVMSSLRELETNFDALVIANQGAHFSAGLNLHLLMKEIQEERWDAVKLLIQNFQQMNMAIKYSYKPVVVAPFKLTLGGGCEIALAAPRIRAGAETQIGLVETRVGLVPAAGGLKEMLLRAVDSLSPDADLLPILREVFDTISTAKVSGSAEEARRLRFLRPADGITMNPNRLVADAKQTALEMVRSGNLPAHPAPRNDIPVAGEAGLAALQIAIHIARRGGYITDYDAVVAGKIAHVLCGGELTGPATVSEQYLLDLEREAFLSLCGEPNTQARIQHMLQTGKPLRN